MVKGIQKLGSLSFKVQIVGRSAPTCCKSRSSQMRGIGNVQAIMIDLTRFVSLLPKEVEDLAQYIKLQREQALCNSPDIHVFADFLALVDRTCYRSPLGLLL